MESSIIIPVFNRLATTVRCLENLHSDNVTAWADILVVDSGSSDGTVEEIRRNWPTVRLIETDPSVWWTEAIRRGMEAASPSSTTIIWLNDDCWPRPGVLKRLHDIAATTNHVTVGQAISKSGALRGGFHKRWFGLQRAIAEGDESLRVDTFNGNCVVIPKKIVEAIGPVDSEGLVHNGADTDYGLRATEAGFESYIFGWAWCETDDHVAPILQSWSLGTLPFSEIRAGMKSYKSFMHLETRKNFYVRHWGIWGYILLISPYIRFYLMWLISMIFGRGALSKIRTRYSQLLNHR